MLLAEGLTWAEIRAKLDCSDSFIDRWSKRFAAERLAGHHGIKAFVRRDGERGERLVWAVHKRILDRGIRLAIVMGGDARVVDLEH